MVGVKPFWPQCNGEEKSSLVKSRQDYLHLKNEVKKLRAHGKYGLSEIDKCTGSTTPKWGHWWVVEDSPKNHWKWEFLGVHSSWCEHLGVGRKGSVSGLASPCLFHRDGNVRIEAHYSSLLCKSSAHGIHDFVSHWSPHRFQFHLTTRTLIIIYTERREILAACTCKKKNLCLVCKLILCSLPGPWFRGSEYRETGLIFDCCKKLSANWSVLYSNNHFYVKVKDCQLK